MDWVPLGYCDSVLTSVHYGAELPQSLLTGETEGFFG